MVVKGFSVLLFGGGMAADTCHNRMDYIAFGKGGLYSVILTSYLTLALLDDFVPDDDKDDGTRLFSFYLL